jgi:hypothetical protein
MTQHATAIGTAGEHLVCADLILTGHTAYMTSQGLTYDIVLDFGGKLLRVAVKSTQKASVRPEREYHRVCYQFAVTRSRRLSTGKTDARPYEAADVDIVAFCALDIRRVAYCHITECAQSMHFDVPGPVLARRVKNPHIPRKTFELYTIQRALSLAAGEIERLPFSWRAQR